MPKPGGYEEAADAGALDGAPRFELRRAELLARAEGEPVVFVRTPKEADNVSDEIRYFRHRVQSTCCPWTVLEQLLPYFATRPERGYQTLLSEGYLYAEQPELAYAGTENAKFRLWRRRDHGAELGADS